MNQRIEECPASLLAIETSTLQGIVAVGRADGPTGVVCLEPGPRHGRSLVPAVQEAARRAGLHLKDLDGIVVGVGPGSFTGTRIGVTAAKTLAYALGVRLIGVDSFDVIARGAPASELQIWVIADAQRGELSAAGYTRKHPGARPHRTGPTSIVPVAAWGEDLDPAAWVMGADLGRLRGRLPESIRLCGEHEGYPRPDDLLAEARRAWASGERVEPWSLEPVYLRPSAAEEKAAKLKGNS